MHYLSLTIFCSYFFFIELFLFNCFRFFSRFFFFIFIFFSLEHTRFRIFIARMDSGSRFGFLRSRGVSFLFYSPFGGEISFLFTLLTSLFVTVSHINIVMRFTHVVLYSASPHEICRACLLRARLQREEKKKIMLVNRRSNGLSATTSITTTTTTTTITTKTTTMTTMKR